MVVVVGCVNEMFAGYIRYGVHKVRGTEVGHGVVVPL